MFQNHTTKERLILLFFIFRFGNLFTIVVIPTNFPDLDTNLSNEIRELILKNSSPFLDRAFVDKIKFKRSDFTFGFSTNADQENPVIYIPEYYRAPSDIGFLLHEAGHIYNNDKKLLKNVSDLIDGLTTASVLYLWIMANQWEQPQSYRLRVPMMPIREHGLYFFQPIISYQAKAPQKETIKMIMSSIVIAAVGGTVKLFTEKIIRSCQEDYADQFAIKALKEHGNTAALEELAYVFTLFANNHEDSYAQAVKSGDLFEKLRFTLSAGPRFLRSLIDEHSSHRKRSLLFQQAADDLKIAS